MSEFPLSKLNGLVFQQADSFLEILKGNDCMSQSNPERVRRALEIFRKGFIPFIEPQMVALNGAFRQQGARLDTQALLDFMQNNWDNVFSEKLGSGGRRSVYRVRDARNMWAHEEPLTITDVYSLLKDIQKLLRCISAHHAVQEIDQLRREIEDEEWATPEREKASNPAFNRPTTVYSSDEDFLLRKRKRIGQEGLNKVEPVVPTQQTSRLWKDIAERALADKRYMDAVDAWDRVIRLDPTCQDAYQNKAYVLYELGRFQEALEVWDQVIRLYPNNSSFHNNRGYMLIMLGKMLEALEASNASIHLDPNNSHALVNKGAALNGLGRFREALETLNYAIWLNPNHSTVYRNIGYTWLRLGKFREALDALNHAIQFNNSDGPSFMNKAVALSELGRYQEALEARKRAEEIASSNTRTKSE